MRAIRDWAPGEQQALMQRLDADAQRVVEEAQPLRWQWVRYEGWQRVRPEGVRPEECVMVPLDQYQRLVRAVARSVAEGAKP